MADHAAFFRGRLRGSRTHGVVGNVYDGAVAHVGLVFADVDVQPRVSALLFWWVLGRRFPAPPFFCGGERGWCDEVVVVKGDLTVLVPRSKPIFVPNSKSTL